MWYKINEDVVELNLYELVNRKYEFSQEFVNNIALAICDNVNTPLILSIINSWWLENIETLTILFRLERRFLKLWLFEEILEEKFEIPTEVTALADQRLQAKQDKNYALADELRNKITELGFQMKDTKDGYEITKI
jgi:cysteinyl-tRNA synthetase